MADHNPFKSAANAIAARHGKDTDTELIQYGQLESHHFSGLVRRYGFEDVRRYIQLMEAKKAGIPRLFKRK